MNSPSMARVRAGSARARRRPSDSALVLLAGDPNVDAGDAVADAAADLDVVRAHVEAAPVGEGSGGDAEDVGDVGGRHQLVERDDIVDGGLAGHCDLRGGGAAVRPLCSATVGGGSWNLSRSACGRDRKSTRLNSSHVAISYAVFC